MDVVGGSSAARFGLRGYERFPKQCHDNVTPNLRTALHDRLFVLWNDFPDATRGGG